MTDQGTSAPAPETGEVAASPDRRRRVLAIGAGVGLLAAAAVAILLATSGGGSKPSTAGLPPQVNALGPQVAQLVALLDKGQQGHYHAEYRAETPAQGSENASMSIELWRSPPRVRQDVVISAAGETATSSAFVLPDGSIGCTKETTAAPWTCQPIPAEQNAAPDTLAKQITEQVGAGPVTVTSKKIAGLSVTCFDLPVAQSAAQVCVTGDGVPALISSGGTKIQLVRFSTEFSGDVFTPPVGPG